MMISEEIDKKLAALRGPLHETYSRLQRLQEALGMPFRPTPMQPVADMWRLVNEIAGMVGDLRNENKALRARIQKLEETAA